MTTTATGRFVEFGTLAEHALRAIVGDGLPDDGWSRVATRIGTLEPYQEVPEALDRLRRAGGTDAEALPSRRVDGAAGPDLVGSERDVLLHYLQRMRDAVVDVSEGLTEGQGRARGVPSGTSLLGIVHHLAGVERHWFERVFLGTDVDVDLSMDVPPERTRYDVVAAYRRACARSDEIVRACPDLSALAAIVNPGEDERDSLRRIMTHVLRETSRHAGHADILRERIDGATGL